jgi:hypothetical protein
MEARLFTVPRASSAKTAQHKAQRTGRCAVLLGAAWCENGPSPGGLIDARKPLTLRKQTKPRTVVRGFA